MALTLSTPTFTPFGGSSGRPAISPLTPHFASLSVKGEIKGEIKIKAKIEHIPPLTGAIKPTDFILGAPCYGPYIIRRLLTDTAAFICYQERHAPAAAWKPSDPKISTKFLLERLIFGKLGPGYVRTLDFEHPGHPAYRSTLITRAPILQRPLEDFEDLYYAVLGRLKEIWNSLTLRLNNGFLAKDFVLHSDGLFPIQPGGTRGEIVTVDKLLSTIADLWYWINRYGIVKPIDDAVRRARWNEMVEALDVQEVKNNEMMIEMTKPGAYEAVKGLEFVAGWSEGMIAAFLDERYWALLAISERGRGCRMV